MGFYLNKLNLYKSFKNYSVKLRWLEFSVRCVKLA